MSSPPTSKRPRTTRACRLCLSCKTKCDVVTELGCRRCREKKRLCSLIDRTKSLEDGTDAPVQPAVLPQPTLSTGFIDPALSAVTARVSKLEQDLDSLSRIPTTQPSPAWPTPGSSTSIPHPQIPRSIPSLNGDSQFPHMHRMIDAAQLDERFYSTAHQQDFPDVVRLGLLTADQVDHGYMVFQRKLTNLVHLPPYCNLDSDSSSRHPFLTLATLAYTPYANTIPLASLISQSINALITGAVSFDAIPALFLLALSPISPDAAQKPQITSSWYLELAHSIGRRLEVEAKVRLALSRPGTLSQVGYSKSLELCLLWENVKTKLNILSLMSTRADTLVKTATHLLPTDHPREAYRIAIAQVQLSARISDALSKMLDRLVREETEGTINGPDAEADHEAWTAMELKVKEQLADPSMTEMMRCDIECARQALASRFGALVRLIPTPLSPDVVRPLLMIIGTIIFPALRNMLDSCEKLTDDQMLHLPSYLSTHYVFGMVLIRRVMSFLPPAGEGDLKRNDRPELHLVEPVEKRLARAGPYQALILSKGKEALDNIAILNAGAVLGDSTNADPWGGFTFMDLDLSMFDWSTLGVQPAT